MSNNEEKNEILTPTEPEITPTEEENPAEPNSESLSSKYKRCVRCGALILHEGDRCRNCGCSQLLPMKEIVRMHTPPYEQKLNTAPKILLAVLSIVVFFLLIFTINTNNKVTELKTQHQTLEAQHKEELDALKKALKDAGIAVEPENPEGDASTEAGPGDTDEESTDETTDSTADDGSASDTTDSTTDDGSESDTTDSTTDDGSESDTTDSTTDDGSESNTTENPMDKESKSDTTDNPTDAGSTDEISDNAE